MSPERIHAAIVVGAGAAGLAAADALVRRELSAPVLEQEVRLAEPWRRRHPQLHLNTHRALSAMPGHPYPTGTGAFPHRDIVISHLETFARDRELAVVFGARVEAIERAGDLWTVTTSIGVWQAKNVILATGRDRVPAMPAWEGADTFGGELIHSAAFGAAESYAGRKVLVVGAGNSGFDVLNHLAGVDTAALWLSARHGPSILPKRIGKVAVHRFAGVMAKLPTSVADAMIAATQGLAFGDLKRFGLPPAPKGGASRLGAEQIAIAVDDGAVAALKAGRIEVVAPVARFAGSGVVLADGCIIEPDIVIAATGYTTGLEALVGKFGLLDGKGVPKANGSMPTGLPGLWFIGMRPSLTSYFHSAGQQAEAIAAKIARSA